MPKVVETILKAVVRACTCTTEALEDEKNPDRAYQQYEWINAQGERAVGRMYFDNTEEAVERHGSFKVGDVYTRSIKLKEYGGKVRLDVWYPTVTKDTVI